MRRRRDLRPLGGCQCPDEAATVCGSSPGACVDLFSDPDHCGTCPNACAAGQICNTGTCCAPGQPVCGSTVRTCCEGTACCGDGSCQTKHSNGLGGFYYDCSPLLTYTRDAAVRAADAWNAGSGEYDLFCAGSCYARQTASQCAVWCYSEGIAGQVGLNTIDNACYCPPQFVVGTWN